MELNARDRNTRAAWENALHTHQLFYPDERVVSFLARRFSNKRENLQRRALDIGCGSGRHLKLLLDYGFNTWGIDYSAASVNRVKSTFGNNKMLKDVVIGDFRDHLFSPFFDAVVSWGVLFLNPPSEMVKNLSMMGKILSHQGRLLVNFRTKENFHYGLGQEVEPGCFILDERAGIYQGMCYTFTDLNDVEEIVSNTQCLKVVHVEKTTLLKNNLSELHSWLHVELKPIGG